MPFAYIQIVSSILLHSWGAKCDKYQCDAYDKIHHNYKVEINKHQVMSIIKAIRFNKVLRSH
jgi:hypothetical protein